VRDRVRQPLGAQGVDDALPGLPRQGKRPYADRIEDAILRLLSRGGPSTSTLGGGARGDSAAVLVALHRVSRGTPHRAHQSRSQQRVGRTSARSPQYHRVMTRRSQEFPPKMGNITDAHPPLDSPYCRHRFRGSTASGPAAPRPCPTGGMCAPSDERGTGGDPWTLRVLMH
jgi:hypothetical protein